MSTTNNGTTKGNGFKSESDLSPAILQDIKQGDKTVSFPNGLMSRNRHGAQKSMNNTARVV